MIFERKHRAALFLYAACAGVLAFGCGGSDDPIPLLWVSQGGVNAPASLLSNTFLTEATVNGDAKAPVVLDTGAPFSLLSTDSFRNEVPDGIGSVGTLTIGGMTLIHVPTIGEGGNTGLGSQPFGGLVGFTAFGQFDFSLNYRDQVVSFGGQTVPPDLQMQRTVLPFVLAGGGNARLSTGSSAIIHFPASRVIVPVDIEGQRHNLLVDSGASVVGLRQSIFDQLRADGRGFVQEDFSLASGQSTSTVMRLRSVVAGGAEVTDPPAASGTGIENLMDNLTQEVGRTVDGMLGGTFLREFFVTFGYPEGSLTLQRYANRDFIHDEYRRIGIELEGKAGPPVSYAIHRIYPGTDAEVVLAQANVQDGDSILAVDGKPMPSNPISADSMFLGNVGSTHTVTFGAAAGLHGQVTLTIRVDELLPLP